MLSSAAAAAAAGMAAVRRRTHGSTLAPSQSVVNAVEAHTRTKTSVGRPGREQKPCNKTGRQHPAAMSMRGSSAVGSLLARGGQPGPGARCKQARPWQCWLQCTYRWTHLIAVRGVGPEHGSEQGAALEPLLQQGATARWWWDAADACKTPCACDTFADRRQQQAIRGTLSTLQLPPTQPQ